MAPPERSNKAPTPPAVDPVDMKLATAMLSAGLQAFASGEASSTLTALGFESASQEKHQALRPAALSDSRADRWPARAGFRRQERADTL